MTTVSVIEDHPVFRQGMALAVEQGGSVRLSATYASVEEFDRDEGPAPDVVLLDLHLPGLEGPEAVAHLVARGVGVLVVSAATARDDVLDAMGAGALGYLGKEADPEEIVRAVEIVAQRGTYVSATLAGYLLQASRAEQGSLELTTKEREVLTLVARGERDRDIADQLFISISTVHSHLDRIRDKTGRRRRADLTRFAVEHGLVDDGADPKQRGTKG